MPVTWAEPPKRKKSKWEDEAEELKAHPGEWGIMASFPPDKDPNARSLSQAMRWGRVAAFRPQGDFESTSAKQPDGTVIVYARYNPQVDTDA